jgi:phosphoglucomutase
MISKESVNNILDKMILSASGWRGVFSGCGNEEGAKSEISRAHRIICGAAAWVFVEYLQNLHKFDTSPPTVLIASDTRPTGKAIADAMIPVLLACGSGVRYADITAAPEIMAYARSMAAESKKTGFIYISASHNPIGHNGLKFGLTDGGVLAAEEAGKLIKNFRSFLEEESNIEKIEKYITQRHKGAEDTEEKKRLESKDEAYRAYFDFCGKVAWGDSDSIAGAVKDGLKVRPLGIVCDFNGSARTVSIDREFFSGLGLGFECINSEPGQIAHRIVPEGESLEPCRALLEKAHKSDESFVLGYVPDCDGDRGNLVIWDDILNETRTLEAQEVFALACVAELSHIVWQDELSYGIYDNPLLIKTAVVVNDPTSMRIDRIAKAFGASIFRAEVGEANVVSLARKLRSEGYAVRILGEGSAGGNITHPSAVRDPLHTVMAIVKFLSVRSKAENLGFFEIWCKCSGQPEKYRDDFTLADIIASLPQFSTTPAYSDDAVLQIKTKDHSLLKDRYQKAFLREWEERKEELKASYGIHNWEAIAYNGMEEKRNLTSFGDSGRGGLKILFSGAEGEETAYIWMRGSATEPVFRLMADAETKPLERYLLEWQQKMIMEADS